MAEALQRNQMLEIPHPGEYEVHVLQGQATVWEDGEPPAGLKAAPKGRGGFVGTFKTKGRLNVLATEPALVSVTDLEEQRVSAAKAASSAQAQPEPARKAAGKSAADSSQAPSPPKAQRARPSSAKTRGAKTNKPTTSQIEAKATGADPARRLAEPKSKKRK